MDWLGDPDQVGNFYVFFKREHFYAFGSKFERLPPEYKTIGETISLEALVVAARDSNSYIIIVMPDCSIYYCGAKTWYQFVSTYDTKRPASNSITPSDLEASVPIKMLKRLNPN